MEDVPVAIRLEDGATLLVEARALATGLPRTEEAGGDPELAVAGRGVWRDREEDVHAFDHTLKPALDTIEQLASELARVVGRISPDKASIEFGIELGIASGKLAALLVSGSSKAALKVTLEWSRPAAAPLSASAPDAPA